MYGKHFSSMYEGSMVGAGAVVFAVMGYIIAKQQPSRSMGSQVRLNPVLLATILGEPQDSIEQAIAFLCAPDPKSTTKSDDGRRLKKIGEFDYQVVNGAKYRAIRDEEARLEQNRIAQRRFRGKTLPGEVVVRRLEQEGYSPNEVDAATAAALPESEFPPQTGGIMTGQPPGRDIN